MRGGYEREFTSITFTEVNPIVWTQTGGFILNGEVISRRQD